MWSHLKCLGYLFSQYRLKSKLEKALFLSPGTYNNFSWRPSLLLEICYINEDNTSNKFFSINLEALLNLSLSYTFKFKSQVLPLQVIFLWRILVLWYLFRCVIIFVSYVCVCHTFYFWMIVFMRYFLCDIFLIFWKSVVSFLCFSFGAANVNAFVNVN